MADLSSTLPDTSTKDFKKDLLTKIKQLDGLSDTERAELVKLLNDTKKYGLIWEDKPEAAEELLRTKLPVFREVVERRIMSEPEFIELENEQNKIIVPQQSSLFYEEKAEIIEPILPVNPPNHILIEGDNLHALTALTFTHEGRIDVMYFDPPYNTGNKDFKYNDTFVDKEDSYRHSKWLSFMHKRLKIAKRLLSDKGVIFISIDINEIAQLKLLCDEIFLSDNFVNIVANINNPKGRSDEKNIATAHEYLLCYSMGIIDFTGWKAGQNIIRRYNKVDEKGVIYREIDLRKTGDNDKREDRPNLFYYFLYNPLTNDFYPTYDLDIPMGYIQIKPLRTDLSEGNWRWALETSIININKLIPKLMGVRKKYTVFEKDILINEDKIKATTVWNQKEVNSERGSEQFIELGFDKKQFPKPKPLGLIKLILELIPKKHQLVLDIFAGSGTTLHATMQLNAEDGGNRQCILVTNNENNICEEVTYERNRRVIQGYTNAKGEWVKGLNNNNLRYYKVDFVDSAKTEVNRRKLTVLSTNLLQIKENCYQDITEVEGFDSSKCSIHTNEKGKYMVVIYHSRTQIETTELLSKWIASRTDLSEKVKIYAFGHETEIIVDDFYAVADKIDAVPLPDAIYNAYRATFRTLKLDKKTPVDVETLHETSLQIDENEI